MKPVIGITCNYMIEDKSAVELDIGGEYQQWQSLAEDYINAVSLAGGVPVILPSLPESETYGPLIAHLDGILFSGGCDVSPVLYGEDTLEEVGTISLLRDRFELGLLREILENTSLPVMGICRGCQVLNTAAGGTLVQHMNVAQTGNHSFMKQMMHVPTHEITTEEGSFISRILGKRALVNSYHHQCVKQEGDGLVITARDCHGVPECIEMPGRKAFTMGVQWHPEAMAPFHVEQLSVIRALVDAAAKL